MFHRASLAMLSRILTAVDAPVCVSATPLPAPNLIVRLALAMQPGIILREAPDD